jgi:excisionase family DNA binding protein
MSDPSHPREVAEPLALSIKEACKLSSLGRTKFYQLLKANKIPARKCGRRTTVLQIEIEEALKCLLLVGRGAWPGKYQAKRSLSLNT